MFLPFVPQDPQGSRRIHGGAPPRGLRPDHRQSAAGLPATSGCQAGSGRDCTRDSSSPAPRHARLLKPRPRPAEPGNPRGLGCSFLQVGCTVLSPNEGPGILAETGRLKSWTKLGVHRLLMINSSNERSSKSYPSNITERPDAKRCPRGMRVVLSSRRVQNSRSV